MITVSTYLRFVLSQRKHAATGVEEGIFETAYEVCRTSGLSIAETVELESLLEWFGKHLAIPTRFNRSRSKGAWRRKTGGIAWLKDSAQTHIENLHRIGAILGEQGYIVTV
jgi:hypothetical protein